MKCCSQSSFQNRHTVLAQQDEFASSDTWANEGSFIGAGVSDAARPDGFLTNTGT